MKNKIKLLISSLFVSVMFLIPLFAVKAEGDVAMLNGQDGYASIEEAFAVAKTGDVVTVISPVTLDKDLTIPTGITLSTTTNTINVPNGFTLTVNGILSTSSMGKLNVSGSLVIETGGVFNADSEISLLTGSGLYLKGNATVNIGGTLDFAINSKIVSDAVDGPVVNIKTSGAIVGNASSLDTANKVVFNNYGGRMGDELVNKVNEGYYNYYPIYDESTNKYYKTFEELTGPIEVKLIAPYTVNGDAEIPAYVVINIVKNNAININGTLTVNGTIDMSDGASQVIATNLYGTGYILLNKATEMAQGYLTYVTIYKDVATTVTFDAVDSYSPSINDILFELGTTEKEAIAIAAKINLGDTFQNHAIAPQTSPYSMINKGYALGIMSEEISDIVEDCNSPQTGNGNLFILGLISLSAAGAAVFCARKIYVLNRI